MSLWRGGGRLGAGLLPKGQPGPAKEPGLGLFTTVATLCNCVMGVGILALPRAVANVGLVPGVSMLLVTALLSFTTLCLLAESVRVWKAQTYAVLVRDAIGPATSKVCAAAVAVNLFGACVGANVAMAANLDDVLVRNVDDYVVNGTGAVERFLDDNPLHLPVPDDRQLWIMALGILLVLPLSLRGSYRALAPASLLSTISVSMLALVTVGFGVQAAFGEGLPCKKCPPLELARWRWEGEDGAVDSVSVIMFAFVTRESSNGLPQPSHHTSDADRCCQQTRSCRRCSTSWMTPRSTA